MMQTPIADSRSPTAWRPDAIHVRDDGEGEPIVLLHGLGMTGEAFRFFSGKQERYRTVVPDLRGHGKSAHLPGPYTTEAMAADLAPMLDTLGIASAHILGHSHGGAIAQVFARTNPERVRSLVLVSTYAIQRATWWQRMLGQVVPMVITRCGTAPIARGIHWFRLAGGGHPLSAPAAKLAACMLAANDCQCLGDTLHWSRRFDSRPWLDTLQIPTLVIAGEADCIIVPQQAVELAQRIPGAQLRILPGAGHALPLSHATELCALISTWLDLVAREASHARRVPAVA